MKQEQNKYYILKILLLIFVGNILMSEIFANDSIASNKNEMQVSLLTCLPDDGEVYSFFGHSAIRVKNQSLNLDVVFDYGVFSFDTPNFILKFIKGDTDYIVVSRPYENFIREFSSRGVEVFEQKLNLSEQDAEDICNFLFWNTQLQNRVYRYNFVENNCSTKIYDIVQNQLGDYLSFTSDTVKQTYRDLFNEHLVVSPWYKMGINLIIGSGADTIVTDKQKVFLPRYLHDTFERGIVIKDSISQNLVMCDIQLLKPDARNQRFLEYIIAKKNVFNEPFYFGIIIVLLVIIMTIFCRNRRIYWLPNLFDVILFGLSSFCGLIIFYLMFFSSHPCVGANWNIIWLNPLPILLALLIFVNTKYRRKYILLYHFINFVLILVFFIGFYMMPQKFEIAFIPYILLLWLRSGYRLLSFKNRK